MKVQSTHLLAAFGLVFLLFIFFAAQCYRVYDWGMLEYYNQRFKHVYVPGQVTGWSDFIKYMWWLWFFVVASGVGSVVIAAWYVKFFLL